MKKKIAFLAAIAVCMSSAMTTGVWAETVESAPTASVTDDKVNGDKETSEPGEAPDASVKEEPDAPAAGEDQKTEEDKAPAADAEDSSAEAADSPSADAEQKPAEDQSAETEEKPAEDTDADKENPEYTWHINHHKAADATVTDEGKEYKVYIANPGGEENGGADKWDVQFRIRGISIEEGHDYRLTYNISTDSAGYYYTKIGNLTATQVGSAAAGEIWHNQFGLSTLRSYTNGYILWDKKVDYSSAWSMQQISAGDTMTAVSEFTGIATLPEAEWVFFLGGKGPATPEGCFEADTTLYFTNLTLVDLTDDKVLVSYNPASTTYSTGDIDENGVVDLSDLTALSMYLLKDSLLDAMPMKAADLNKDGEVDITDIAVLKQIVMGETFEEETDTAEK